MKVAKYFLLILLILISLTSIFNSPGVNLFNSFYSAVIPAQKPDIMSWLRVFLQYPPGVYLTLEYLLSQFVIDPHVFLFDRQSVWLVVKFLLYSFYLLTYLSLLYLKRANKTIIKVSFLDLSIAYFASVPILLSSVGIIFFDILSAPFLVLSVTFLLRRNVYLSAIFYLAGLFFNWSFFVLAPVFLFVFLKNKLTSVKKIVLINSFLVAPLVILLFLSIGQFGNSGGSRFLNPASFSKLLSLPFEYVFRVGKINGLGWSVSILAFLAVTFGLGGLIKYSVLKKIGLKKSLQLLLLPLIPLAFSLSLFWANSLSFVLLSLFLLIFIFFISKFKSLPVNASNIIQGLLALYLIASLFLQDLNAGAILTIVLLAFLVYIINPIKQNLYFLVLINLFSFINIFSNYGTSGTVPIAGDYFIFFQSVFSAFLVLFAIAYLNLYFAQKNIVGRISSLKWLIIISMVLLNLSWIPTPGSPDHVSWTQYSLASIEQPNPFAAQTLVDQRYPPLSTAILGIFANSWNIIIGPSENYVISTKLSVIIFYCLTVFLLIKFIKIFSGREKLSLQDKLFVILTTFSLIIQTQGFADLNIHLIPTLFISIYFLFKKKYLLAGLFMGITISIKWQPMILLPLFAATIFDFKNFVESLKRSISFVAGLLPIPIVCWALVLINPGGKEAFERATDYLIHGAPMLSGQALNLNWIVTYIMHFFEYNHVESFTHLEGLNRQVRSEYAPWIFQGILFLTVWFVIIIKYWLSEKKDIRSFLAASLMIFFSHHQLNKSAYEKHIFYVVIFMLFLYLIRPTNTNRWLLILFDAMTVMNLVFFYGFTGTGALPRRFFDFDITIIFSAFYLVVFLWVLWRYFKGGQLFERNSDKA